jgi:hypothetical protein
MNKEAISGSNGGERNHLARLRDFLDLPLDALAGDDRLVFMLDSGHRAIASYAANGHLMLVCEVAEVDALNERAWRLLASHLSDGYDADFPVSVVTVDQHLALVWTCDACIDADVWLNRAEDALTASFALGEELADRAEARDRMIA